MDSKNRLKNLFLDALEQCSPSNAIKQAVKMEGNLLSIGEHDFDLTDRPVYLLAVGKAAVPMYSAVEEILGSFISDSLVITSDPEQAKSCNASEVIVGDHPIPKEESLQAGKTAVRFVENIPGAALILTLISGGTSSLMCLPPDEISMTDISLMYELLNNSGATIHEINVVRKHCSQIKGGQLLQSLHPEATLVDLVISDVPDNDLSIIGSGPTIPDLSTLQDAYHILLEYELWDQLPQKIQQHFKNGIDGQEVEMMKQKEDPHKQHYSNIISSVKKMAHTIAALAEGQGLNSWIAEKAFNDDVEVISAVVAEKILADHNHAHSLFIFYGESTVQVHGQGKGGRNQELALRGALRIAGYENITWLSAGTDGVDGPTDAAGAVVYGSTIARAQKLGLDPQKYLTDNDSYHFHEKMGSLLKIGPTGNNLMDVTLVYVE